MSDLLSRLFNKMSVANRFIACRFVVYQSQRYGASPFSRLATSEDSTRFVSPNIRIRTQVQTAPVRLSATEQIGQNERRRTPVQVAAPRMLIYKNNVAYNRLRRLSDVVGSLLLLTIAIPILLIASLAILLEDGRPILFHQRRVGRFGRLFTIYKLRTMRKERCVDSYSPTTDHDTRITRVGYWLRRSSIDELPQLINIVRGEMAFVGPRPEMPFVVREYQAWQHLRHLVTPGVTGFWQTTVRKTVPLHLPEATMIDLDYIRQASHSTDAAILLRTVRKLISAEGAY